MSDSSLEAEINAPADLALVADPATDSPAWTAVFSLAMGCSAW